jgi:HEAT repeat protein
VLGMLGAVEAHEDLARVIDEDDGEGVREYCVASLGRMRARVQMPMLADLFKRTEDADLRLMIAQAISRMVGAADYPM